VSDLNVREWGDRRDPTLLFWHALGAAGSGATIAELAPVLAERGHRVLAIDGPGFGSSPVQPPERYALGSLAEAALRVAQEDHVERFAFMGHSWGGAVALACAHAAPERVTHLVLVDSGHIDYGALQEVPEQPVEDWIRDAEARVARWVDEAAFERDLREGVRRWSPRLLEAYLPGLRRDGDGLAGAPAAATGAAMWGVATHPVSAYWPTVAAHALPTLLLLATEPPHGEQNRQHAGRFQAALPHADVRWVPDAGHGILADVGPSLAFEIADWLER
jgi:pimeloyl-ACP methyl ester carboxylesterase